MATELFLFHKENIERGKTGALCKSQNHKWHIHKINQLDSEKGLMVTVYQCEKCPARKVTAQ